MTDITPALLAEIALEMTIQTGQVYTCPDGKHIQSAKTRYYLREGWRPNHNKIAINATGPECDSPLRTDENTIHLDPNRKPADLARDILRRLPDAPEVYARAHAYHLKKQAETEAYQQTAQLLQAHGFTPYSWKGGESYGHFHADKFREIQVIENRISSATITGCTPAQLIQIKEILDHDRPTD